MRIVTQMNHALLQPTCQPLTQAQGHEPGREKGEGGTVSEASAPDGRKRRFHIPVVSMVHGGRQDGACYRRSGFAFVMDPRVG